MMSKASPPCSFGLLNLCHLLSLDTCMPADVGSGNHHLERAMSDVRCCSIHSPVHHCDFLNKELDNVDSESDIMGSELDVVDGELDITNSPMRRRCERFTINLIRCCPRDLTHCPQVPQDLRFCNVNVNVNVIVIVGLEWVEVEGMLVSYEMRGF